MNIVIVSNSIYTFSSQMICYFRSLRLNNFLKIFFTLKLNSNCFFSLHFDSGECIRLALRTLLFHFGNRFHERFFRWFFLYRLWLDDLFKGSNGSWNNWLDLIVLYVVSSNSMRKLKIHFFSPLSLFSVFLSYCKCIFIHTHWDLLVIRQFFSTSLLVYHNNPLWSHTSAYILPILFCLDLMHCKTILDTSHDFFASSLCDLIK